MRQQENMMSEFDDLLARIESLTGLTGRDAAKVAFRFDEDHVPTAPEIVDAAIDEGFDVERKHGQVKASTPEPEMTMNPAEVLSEVYMVMPRVLCQHMPRIGRAPEEARALFGEIIDELPEDMKALLVKIDVLEGAATFWLRDEANDVDRPIGPIDLTRYDSERALEEAFGVLLQRLPKVIAADFN